MYLIKGVRVTLIKNALSNLSAYFMSLFPLPVSVANCLEKLQHNFLWGGMGEEFKFRLVSLIKVCTMISKEGLGVCNLFVFNWVLMGSCGVTFMRERPYGGWLLIPNMTMLGVGGVLMRFMAYGVGLWKNMRRVWRIARMGWGSRRILGDGSKIQFLHDFWCRDQALKTSFPDLELCLP
jgi:hypothetical protein